MQKCSFVFDDFLRTGLCSCGRVFFVREVNIITGEGREREEISPRHSAIVFLWCVLMLILTYESGHDWFNFAVKFSR